MKISIGSKILEGPYGGGNEFLKNLYNYFQSKGHNVINHLNEPDIDVILLTNPLFDSETATFNNYDIDYYVNFINSRALVFQRINECDERKGTSYINSKLEKFNKNVDVNIFVSNWLKNNFKDYQISKKPSFVVMGGPSKKIFNMINKSPWNGEEKIKVVTHHWSDNLMKGYDFYKLVDEILSSEINKKLFEFTIIGNTPKSIEFNNSILIPPISGNELANELKKNHIYLTASVNEPSGNHHMEGAMCGLPIMYLNSGAIPEYCSEYGVEIKNDLFLLSLEKIKRNYFQLFDKLKDYEYSFENASNEINTIFLNSLNMKEELYNKRVKESRVLIIFKYINSKILLLIYSKFVSLKKVFGKLKRLLF